MCRCRCGPSGAPFPWQREENLRWYSRRQECYIEFSSVIMQYINVGHRMAAGIGQPTAVEQLTADAGLPALASAESDLSLCWARLLILGSSEAIRAAQDWRSEAWQLESFARGRRNDPT